MLGDWNCPFFGTWVVSLGSDAGTGVAAPGTPPPPKRSLGAPSHPFLHVAFIPQCLWRVSGVGSPEGGAWMCPRALPCRDSRTYAEDTGVNKD